MYRRKVRRNGGFFGGLRTILEAPRYIERLVCIGDEVKSLSDFSASLLRDGGSNYRGPTAFCFVCDREY